MKILMCSSISERNKAMIMNFDLVQVSPELSPFSPFSFPPKHLLLGSVKCRNQQRTLCPADEFVSLALPALSPIVGKRSYEVYMIV